MQIDPTKLTIDTINTPYIHHMVLAQHNKYCKAANRYGIFIDWNRSVDNQGKLNIVHHYWHDPDYWTIDIYCECQSCNKSGFMTVKIDDKFAKIQLTKKTRKPTDGTE